MAGSRAVRYVLYSTSLIVLSKIIYHGYRALKTWCIHGWYNAERQLSVVIWSSGSTGSCSENHRNCSKVSGTNSQRTEMSFDKIQIMERGSVCSNPYCMTSNIGLLVDLVNATKYTIDIAMNTFTSFEMSSALLDASKRGVTIRIISDREMAYSTSSQVFRLEKSGVAVCFNSNPSLRTMHHKFCLLDSPSTIHSLKIQKGLEDMTNVNGIIMTGSLNWTAQGFSVILSDPRLKKKDADSPTIVDGNDFKKCFLSNTVTNKRFRTATNLSFFYSEFDFAALRKAADIGTFQMHMERIFAASKNPFHYLHGYCYDSDFNPN
uniref:Mitochondrial cardiolipin hydrolase n=1 Tax=Glossina pallidipes TaxID=7398 RepID=A0A1B0A4N2_GLOPL